MKTSSARSTSTPRSLNSARPAAGYCEPATLLCADAPSNWGLTVDVGQPMVTAIALRLTATITPGRCCAITAAIGWMWRSRAATTTSVCASMM